MSSLTDPTQAHLLSALASVRRKARVLSALFGLGELATAIVAMLLVIALMDWLFNMPLAPRLFFIAVAGAATLHLAWTRIARPLIARLSLSDVAGHLENAFPAFDDRLRSTVDFVRQEMDGSDVMKQQTILRAGQIASGIDLSSALVLRPVVYSTTAALAAVGVAILLGLSFPQYADTLLDRLIGRNVSYPKTVVIELVKSAPQKVVRGQRIDMRLRLTRGDRAGRRAIVYYQYDNGPIQQQIMPRNDDGTFSVGLDARGHDMKVWFESGDDQTPARAISVVPRLAIAQVEARITPPPYAKLDPTNFNLAQAPAPATIGSNVQLVVTFNKALAGDKPIVIEPVRPDMHVPQVKWERPSPAVAIGTWTAMDPLRFRLRATDTDNFENTGLEEFEITVRPDQMPSVMIEVPRGNEDRTPVSVVKLEAVAEDDFDIKTMVLVVDRHADKKHWEIPLTEWTRGDLRGERRRFRVRYEWDLANLQDASLKPGDVLEYHVRVTDNFELNGAVHEPVPSGKLKINIISQEQLGVQVTEAIRAISERVKQVMNAQNRTKQETQNLRKEMGEKKQPDAGDRTALNRLTDQQSTLTSQTRQLAGQMADQERRLDDNRSENQELKDIARDVKNTLSDTAENPMSQASQKLSEAQQHSDGKNAKATPQQQSQQSQQRGSAMETAENKQQQASEQLDKALKKMDNLGTFEQLLQKVRDALNQQQAVSKRTSDVGKQTIGKDPDKLTPEEKKKLDDIAADQKKLAEKTEQLTKELDKAANQTQKSDPASSKAMQQAAQQSQQQQVSSNQSQAAQSAQQNQQAPAQARQRQAELGLQMMLDTLREAERRKLEELAKELAKLQELIANLIRRQAGHNIDNLRFQNLPATLKQITEDLLKKSERLADKQPPLPSKEQITVSQAQTETNTRDVGKTAERLPRAGAEIAAALTKAASQMERATVNLKATQLPEAYDPFQVKALAALEEAKEKADKAAEEIAQQQEDANRETLRQAYEKIRTEQDVINKETVRIDESPRLPDGSRRREDDVNLGKLPGQQGAVADKVKKLEEPLRDLGGVVYVWANKDIFDSMTNIKEDLAKPTTAKPTQIEEKRVLDQLDAMIRNLAVKPKQTDFHTPPGGGGGGGSGKPPKPQMPSEAELRLLKELQIAVNNATKLLNAEPKKDQPKLVALGGRQGELRGVLDELVKKASRGQVKLDPEPDAKERLPEEAGTADIENQEFDEWLRGGKSGDQQLENDMKMVGRRMGRSRQRLALDHDPGKTTQLIQDRILQNMDNLIEMARQQQAQASSSGKPSQGQKGQKPQPGQGSKGQQQVGTGISQPNRSSSPAQSEARGGSGDNTADTSKDIRGSESEWGHLTPRERQAIIDGLHDRSHPKYKQLIDDYYEMLSKKGSKAE